MLEFIHHLTCTMVDSAVFVKHPDWTAINIKTGKTDINGYGTANTCINNDDFWKTWFAALRRLLTEAPCDGIMIDEIQFFAQHLCGCEGCSTKFRADTGLEPPTIFDIPRDQAFEQYYSLMAGQVLQMEQDADGDGVPIDMDMPGKTSSDSLTDDLLEADAGASLWEEDELMTEKVNREIETAQRTNQWGSLKGDLKALIESSLISKQNFRAILSQFRASILSTKRHLTRMRPNRRYGFDAMGSQYAYSTHLLVAVDVSGSVPDEDIKKFLAVINRFFKQGIERIDVIEFDSRITTDKPLQLKQATGAIHISGRGGTNFQPAIDYYYEHEEYDGLVFLTDGYAPVPKLPDDKRHKPLAWILTSNGGNEENLAPFGPIVRITGL